MNNFYFLQHLLVGVLVAPVLVSTAFIASVSSALASISSAGAATRSSGINFSSGVYTVVILPRSSTRPTSTSTSTSTSTTSSSTITISTSTITTTSTVTATPTSTITSVPATSTITSAPATSTITPTSTITSTPISSTSTTTMTPTITVTSTSSVCPISYATISILPSNYCATFVLCQAAVSGCPVYNSSFMSQLSSLAASTATSSASTLTVTSTSTSTNVVISSITTGTGSSNGQTIVTSGAIVIQINDDGTTSTILESAGAKRYRANSTNSSSAQGIKSGAITAIITLLSAFFLGMVIF